MKRDVSSATWGFSPPLRSDGVCGGGAKGCLQFWARRNFVAAKFGPQGAARPHCGPLRARQPDLATRAARQNVASPAHSRSASPIARWSRPQSFQAPSTNNFFHQGREQQDARRPTKQTSMNILSPNPATPRPITARHLRGPVARQGRPRPGCGQPCVAQTILRPADWPTRSDGACPASRFLIGRAGVRRVFLALSRCSRLYYGAIALVATDR